MLQLPDNAGGLTLFKEKVRQRNKKSPERQEEGSGSEDEGEGDAEKGEVPVWVADSSSGMEVDSESDLEPDCQDDSEADAQEVEQIEEEPVIGLCSILLLVYPLFNLVLQSI